MNLETVQVFNKQLLTHDLSALEISRVNKSRFMNFMKRSMQEYAQNRTALNILAGCTRTGIKHKTVLFTLQLNLSNGLVQTNNKLP